MWKETLAFRNSSFSSLFLLKYLLGISVLEEVEQLELKAGSLVGLRSTQVNSQKVQVMIRPRINVIWESICEKENIQKPSSEAFQNHLVRNLILIDISHLICLNGPPFFAPPWSVPPSTSGGSLFSLSLSPYSQSSLVQPYKPALDPIFSFCPPHLHLYNTQVPLGCSFGLGTLDRKF